MPEETACRSGVTSAPIERWHLRHLKLDAPCRAHAPKAVHIRALGNGTSKAIVETRLESAALPDTWAAEYSHARADLAARMRPALGASVDAYSRITTRDWHPVQGSPGWKLARK